MLNSARRRTPQRQLQPITVSVPAPVGGVNARDAIAQMPPTDAISAINFFGTPAYVGFRNGCQIWATGLPGPVETLMAYNGPSTRKLFAASSGNIYEVTNQAAVGAPVVTGLATSRLQHSLFNAGGGTVLLTVNGLDTPQVYNGSTWAASTINGVGLTPANLITITIFKQRCWFVEKNSMKAWYTDVQAFQGTATAFPLGAIFKKGGYLVNMATWTIDNVSGMDDYAAFITSEGEVAIYQGTDPTQANTFALVGIFTIGRPIGIRCYTKYAADILVITADGLTPLSKAMLTDRTQSDSQLTNKILNYINTDVQLFNANFGWQVTVFPLGNKIILNVPDVTNSKMHQWVMNSLAKSWWRFEGWNANCFEVQQDNLFFGAQGTVYLGDIGQSDAGMAISVDCKPAFTQSTGKLYTFMMARPIFQASAVINPTITLNVDYNDAGNPSAVLIKAAGATWDISLWDVTSWGDLSPTISNRQWQGISGLGYVASGRISLQVSGIIGQWYSTDYLITEGGPV